MTASKWENYYIMDLKKREKAVKIILAAIGEDPNRHGLKETPARVARMYAEIFSGISSDPAKEIKIFHEGEHEEMIMVKDIPFYSVCEHHLVPFIGKAHVAYIPTKGKVTGLSKLVRVVEGFAKRLQVQERLTSQIADTLMEKLDPRGVLVIIEAEHLCMSMRGIKKPGSVTVTSAVRGIFRKNTTTKAEALALIRS
jgi:GTP cyclohydrolase IA